MSVLSTEGEPLGGPFASVTREGDTLILKVTDRRYGEKSGQQRMELTEDAFMVLLSAMVDATAPKPERQ